METVKVETTLVVKLLVAKIPVSGTCISVNLSVLVEATSGGAKLLKIALLETTLVETELLSTVTLECKLVETTLVENTLVETTLVETTLVETT